MPALTAAQLALLRSQPQMSEWWMHPIVPPTVFAARVNDGAITVGTYIIPYDSVSIGAYTDVIAGQTIWIGSSPDSYDIARLRVRSATAAHIVVAENSDVAWADNYYITVKREWLCWSVRPFINGSGTVFKDYDIAYSDQTVEWPPVAMMGDPVCKPFAGNPTPVYFDGSFSYPTAPGATITGYLWDFGDGTTSAAMTPGNHNYTSAGDRWASLTVTDSNGKTNVSYRPVSLPAPGTLYTARFQQQSLDAQIDGGWTGKCTVFAPLATIGEFPERAPCFLISADTFGITTGSVGYPRGRENVVLFGYIQDDSVEETPELSEITFTLESVDAVARRAAAITTFVMDATAPVSWDEGLSLTIFRSLVYLLAFQSTLFQVADVSLYPDATPIKIAKFPEDNLWNMLSQFAKGARLLRCGVTRTGRVIIGSDPNLLTVANRTTVVTVCQLATGDWTETVTIPEEPFPLIAFRCISGIQYDGDPANDPTPMFGMSPGHPPKEYGENDTSINNLAINSQHEINTLAGLSVGQDNNPYGDIVIPLWGNWIAAFDPAYQEYVTAPAGGFVTSRGTLLAGESLIVRKVSINFDWEAGAMRSTLTCEATTQPEIATNGDCYTTDAPLPPDSLPPIDIIVPPPEPTGTIAAPGSFVATPCYINSTSVKLTWARVFNVDGYKIYRDAVLIATTTTPLLTTYVDSGLAELTGYTYTVRAYKASVNGTLTSGAAITTCDAPVPFHNKVVMATPNHVYEFTAFGGFGYTTPAPVDIKGNIVGVITDFHVQDGVYVAIANNQMWRYAGGSTWDASVDAAVIAKNSCIWSTEFFPGEDGTGTHGLAWWGCRGICTSGPGLCGVPHTIDTSSCIHFGYQARSALARLIGNHTTLANSLGNVLSDCSVKENGLWDLLVSGGEPGLAMSPGDYTPPDLYSLGFGIFSHTIGVPQHLSPYDSEAFHLFLNDLDTFTFTNRVFLDGVDVTATWPTAPVWVTDDNGDTWAWAFDSQIWKNGSLVLSEATIAAVSGLASVDTRLTGGIFGVNIAPGSLVRRTIVYIRTFADFGPAMFLSTDDGATWSMVDVQDTRAENIFTVAGEDDKIYFVGIGGEIWTSADDGANLWQNYAGCGEGVLGFWVDPAS